jgi:hypothetical protein
VEYLIVLSLAAVAVIAAWQAFGESILGSAERGRASIGELPTSLDDVPAPGEGLGGGLGPDGAGGGSSGLGGGEVAGTQAALGSEGGGATPSGGRQDGAGGSAGSGPAGSGGQAGPGSAAGGSTGGGKSSGGSAPTGGGSGSSGTGGSSDPSGSAPGDFDSVAGGMQRPGRTAGDGRASGDGDSSGGALGWGQDLARSAQQAYSERAGEDWGMVEGAWDFATNPSQWGEAASAAGGALADVGRRYAEDPVGTFVEGTKQLGRTVGSVWMGTGRAMRDAGIAAASGDAERIGELAGKAAYEASVEVASGPVPAAAIRHGRRLEDLADQGEGASPGSGSRAPDHGRGNGQRGDGTAARAAAREPSEVLDDMIAEKRDKVGDLDPHDRSGSWREKVTPDTPMVRVVDRAELEKLLNDGRVWTRSDEAAMRDPIGPGGQTRHQRQVEQSHRRGPDGRLERREMGVTSGGSASPAIPVSAWAPAGSGYVEAVRNGDKYLVKFKDRIHERVSPGNNTPAETEYFIPHRYTLDDVEYVADVGNDRYLYGAPDQPGDGQPPGIERTRGTPEAAGSSAGTQTDDVLNPQRAGRRLDGLATRARRIRRQAKRSGLSRQQREDLEAQAAEAVERVNSARQRQRSYSADYEDKVEALNRAQAEVDELERAYRRTRDRTGDD